MEETLEEFKERMRLERLERGPLSDEEREEKLREAHALMTIVNLLLTASEVRLDLKRQQLVLNKLREQGVYLNTKIRLEELDLAL